MRRFIFSLTLFSITFRIVRNEGIEEGSLREARSALRRVLAKRKLGLSAADEARIDTCADLATLERWLEQAIDASSAAEALR